MPEILGLKFEILSFGIEVLDFSSSVQTCALGRPALLNWMQMIDKKMRL